MLKSAGVPGTGTNFISSVFTKGFSLVALEGMLSPLAGASCATTGLADPAAAPSFFHGAKWTSAAPAASRATAPPSHAHTVEERSFFAATTARGRPANRALAAVRSAFISAVD